MANETAAVKTRDEMREERSDIKVIELNPAIEQKTTDRKAVRSGSVYDLDAYERRRKELDRAERLKKEIGEEPITGIEDRLVYRFVKRAFDIVFSAAVVIVLAIPVALACIAIRLESAGAPVYAQERVGMNGRMIRVLKLRSMVADAGDVEKYLSDEQMRQWQVERKVDDDPRVTRVGAFIRKTSLDELPQFLNVLKGDLSVIGPRPITKAELEQHFTVSESVELLSVRPGITGLWQATERNAATFESGRRQHIELRYVRERGFAMDIKCFFGTFGAMFGKKRTGR